ncbi:MAG: hypothetical protein HKN32_09995, partial [Flavobacteriales bacterium]|nr:hypothetical protein [Flavobacteriales bacterium]
MNVLLITDIFPTSKSPREGEFVRAQYDRFLEVMTDDEEVSIFHLSEKRQNILGKQFANMLALLAFVPVLFQRYHVIHVHNLSPLARLVKVYRLFHPSVRLLLTMHGPGMLDDIPYEGPKNLKYRELIHSFDKIMPVGKSLHEPLYKKLGVYPHHTICAG